MFELLFCPAHGLFGLIYAAGVGTLVAIGSWLLTKCKQKGKEWKTWLQ